ncbi:uncharacterized protein KQ657_003932, partial [Scheffersomyces spartinae]
NFPVSVMNGVTSEGGLVSLTFKSVTCADLVENLDVMKSALVPGLTRDTRIRDDDIDYSARIAKLQAELAQMREAKSSNEIGLDITNKTEKILAEKYITTGGKGYFESTINEGISVEKFEDVKDIDLGPYQRVTELIPEDIIVDEIESTMEPTEVKLQPTEIAKTEIVTTELE